MNCKEFCTCPIKDCPSHPEHHNWDCTPCIKKNLENHEIPYCFWEKIGDTKNAKSPYTFLEFAKKVMEGESDTGGNT